MKDQKQPSVDKKPMPKAKKELIASIVVVVCAVIVIVCGAIMIPDKGNRTASIIGIVMTCCGAALLGFGIFDVIKNSKKWKIEKEAH